MYPHVMRQSNCLSCLIRNVGDVQIWVHSLRNRDRDAMCLGVLSCFTQANIPVSVGKDMSNNGSEHLSFLACWMS